MNGPVITGLKLWQRHERMVLDLVRDALRLLTKTQAITGDEIPLTRDLYHCINKVNTANRLAGRPSFDFLPACDALNASSAGTAGAASGDKRPDLQWSIIDAHGDQNACDGIRSFAVECKRLGARSSTGQRFNQLYVSRGVCRYVDTDWRYGECVATGAMVGYVQSLTPSQIVGQVNTELSSRGLPSLTLPQSVTGPLIEMDHRLKRRFPDSPFRLVHLWIT